MNIAIIGAGASGLLLAIKLNKLGIVPTIFNKGKIARKVLASGNGKCNISNSNPKLEDYFNNEFAYDIVKNNMDELFQTFNDLEIYTKEMSEGRLYPYSESSQSVVDIFLKNIKSRIEDVEITSIKEKDKKYYLNDTIGPFDNVVIASGSIASYKKGFYPKKPYANLGLLFEEESPALVGFKVKESIKEMSGARSKVTIKLFDDGKFVSSDEGEIIFKDDGISGICVMNLSSYYQRGSKRNTYVEIDLASGIEYTNYQSILTPKIYGYIMKNKLDPHKLKLTIAGTYDFEFAQVACGGISLKEVDDNLQLKKYKKIYACGEALDVDAKCGGYNLMFAFTSALQIFKELKNEISNK